MNGKLQPASSENSGASHSSRNHKLNVTTPRRHLGVLVDCGIIIRRDSPNGKRFARKGRDGEIEHAYGFDLSPIVARAEEYKSLAEAVQTEKKAFRVVKERLTLLRRDIVKMIETGIEEGVPANWGRVHLTYQGIVSQIPRTAPRQALEAISEELEGLWHEVREALETFTKTQIMDTNESQSGCHIQNSKPDSTFESEQSFRKKNEADGNGAETDNVRRLPRRELPLGIVLDACPNLLWLMKDGQIRHWRDLLAAAELARPQLGISPSAWSEAREILGEQQAAITLAGIYQRSDQINNAGGYLRSLTERARDGKFSAWPMIMALLRAKLDTSKQAPGVVRPTSSASGGHDAGDEGSFPISDALKASLRKSDA